MLGEKMKIPVIILGFFALCVSHAEPALDKDRPKTKKAIFAGGCFWCMEKPFEELEGVLSVISGYTGGKKIAPSYKEVSAGITGHREAVEITYDPQRICYKALLEVFWKQINPTDAGGQFVDRGFQYTSAIYFLNEEQKQAAESSKLKLQEKKLFTKKIITPIVPASSFYRAEDYHQDYYKKSSLRYRYYRYRSGRDQFLDKLWGKKRSAPPSLCQD
jgi:methionine-S-sulfoxide reductase